LLTADCLAFSDCTSRVDTGREAPGKAYRLYTEASFAGLAPTTAPEITRVNLGNVVLQLKVGVESHNHYQNYYLAKV
jgi:HrpA-like RNA helicase